MKKWLPWLILLTGMLILACNFRNLLPNEPVTRTPAKSTPPPAASSPATPTRVEASGTPTPLARAPIVYYHFVEMDGQALPAGSVVVLAETLVLAPAASDQPRGGDVAMNLRAALQTVFRDPRNAWQGENLKISGAAFQDGAAQIQLQGQILAPGDIVRIAARLQILLTVFAESAVQTAVIKLEGNNIANLGISHESQAKPAGYTFTRAEIETFMTKNAPR